ncbi:ATP-NAD kinase-like domain-containing protein [Fennellomyces sp. T-0311]|nr:ATP-NAD kinase-like domain-containing protein [Fennellomyces sp. T-0311]
MPENHDKIETSVRLQDTETEGRPSVYVFIFVNPLSGDRKGSDLIHLPITHFRLRRLPQVQVEIHNYLDPEDRQAGIDRVALIQSKVKASDLPPIKSSPDAPGGPRAVERPRPKPDETFAEANGRMSKTIQTRHIHVWSAGGDGTVMSVFDMLVENNIDLDLVFLSCIPFGTGNDFSQVMGWGRTEGGNVIGSNLENLEKTISDRFEHADAARLDIWQVEMTSYDNGQVRLASEPKKTKRTSYKVNMCNYMSIGVQGYVGRGFEKHRTTKRCLNIAVYTIESSKWVFCRKFPPISHFVDELRQDGEMVLEVPMGTSPDHNDTGPVLASGAIDLVIQNIPHIWGSECDIWGEATEGLEAVRNRSGPTDPDQWTPQLALDGKLEVFVLENMTSYIKKLANIRKHVARIGQFGGLFEIHFREPARRSESRQTGCFSMCSSWNNHYTRNNILGVMCDGEFYSIRCPQMIRFRRIAQVTTLGRNDAEKQGRLVQDEQKQQGSSPSAS